MLIFFITALILSFVLLGHHLKLFPEKKKQSISSLKQITEEKTLNKSKLESKYIKVGGGKMWKCEKCGNVNHDTIDSCQCGFQRNLKNSLKKPNDKRKENDSRYLNFALITTLIFSIINSFISGNLNILFAFGFFIVLFGISIFLAAIINLIRLSIIKRWDKFYVIIFILSIVVSIFTTFGSITNYN